MSEYKRVPSFIEEDAKKIKELIDLNREPQDVLFEKEKEIWRLKKEGKLNGPKLSELSKEVKGLKEKIEHNKNFWKEYHEIN